MLYNILFYIAAISILSDMEEVRGETLNSTRVASARVQTITASRELLETKRKEELEQIQ
jgi:hypothetical protein